MLLGRSPSPQVLYDVADPNHPRLLCRITGTTAHIRTADTMSYLRPGSTTGTEIVLRSVTSGSESVVGSIPHGDLQGHYYGPTAWLPDGSLAATVIPPADPVAGDQSQVWLFSQRYAGVLYTYPYPLTDCICRFGLTQPTLALSPDGQYLVSGWVAGKGAAPLYVYRVSDRSLVKAFDLGYGFAIWGRTGHRLFVSGSGLTPASWTPESGMATLAGAQQWSFLAGLSPDGSQVAYTAYADAQQQQLRAYIYDTTTGTNRLLIDRPRSQVVFVKPRWVWYLEEAACDSTQPGCGPWATAPTGKVFAMDLASGVETVVAFGAGEGPTAGTGGPVENLYSFAPGEFWPAS